MVLADLLGHRCDRRDRGGGIAPQHGGHRHRLPHAHPLPAVLRAAVMLEPAHRRPILAQDLHPVNPGVVLPPVGRLGDDQRPVDLRAAIVGPAEEDRQDPQIGLVARQDNLLARRPAHGLRRQVQDASVERQVLDRVDEALGGFRVLQEGEELADLLQPRLVGLKPHRDPLDRAEEVGQQGDRRALDLLEQDRGALGGQKPVENLGDFEAGIDLVGDADELALPFQHREKFAQVGVGHGRSYAMTRSAVIPARISRPIAAWARKSPNVATRSRPRRRSHV